MERQNLTQKELKRQLHYDPETGIFTRLVASYNNSAKIGDVAGGTDPRGYVTIRINKGWHRCHRLAWLYMNGYFPEHGLDHVDRNPSNNSINNLREASKSCNARNSKEWSTNTSGVKGVRMDGRRGTWYASVMVNYKTCYGGAYEDFNDAVLARLALEQSVNWPGCNSNSSAYLYAKKHGLIKF